MREPRIDGLPVSQFLEHCENYNKVCEALCVSDESAQKVFVMYPDPYIKLLAQIEELYNQLLRYDSLQLRYGERVNEVIKLTDQLNSLRRWFFEHDIDLPFSF